ncbi:MAG: hypothetical protein KGO96_11315 [Elusimicrobia bacterium]|nr:hypothetical protein [Elusimicrobiota bacterium]MDE2237852.1 hypothetical protein [Elusimicrobiota bacterium]MDE2426481.1 hypothetical protein [Elusimicrobiota bacterium]
MLKHVREKAEHCWSLTKKLVVLASVWGLVFSVVTVARLGVAFDYDDTLVSSAGSFSNAFAHSAQPYSTDFWTIVNQSYDLEQPKLLAYPLAWAFRLLGFRVSIITTRPPIHDEALKKEWRHLVGRGRFIFVKDSQAKRDVLQSGNYMLFFGDSDSDIKEARLAHVYPIRVRRGPKSIFKLDYHPGAFGELVLPYSQY